MPEDRDGPVPGFHERRARRIIEEYEPSTYGCEPGAIDELRGRAAELGFEYNKRHRVTTPHVNGRKRKRPRKTYLEVSCLRCTAVTERPSRRCYDGIKCPECGSTWIDIQRRQLAGRDDDRD